MTTFRRLAFAGGALICAMALWQCNDTPMNNNPADLAVAADLASPPDLAQALSLTAISPSNAANAGGTMIQLTGTGFVQGSTVTIGGAMATVSFVSSTQLTVTVPAKAATCGPADVQVANPDSQKVSRSDLFMYRAASFMLGAPTNLTMGTNVRQVIAADLNKDGNLDLASANSGSANITVRLGSANGTFGAVQMVALGAGTSPYAIAAADA